jgi:hypothetical protein
MGRGGRVSTVIGRFHGIVKGIVDIGKILSKGKLVNDMSEIYFFD